MRFVVYGAGAIGGVVGCRLSEASHEVSIVARGAHLDAIRRSGLTLETPDGRSTHRLAAAEDPSDLDLGDAVVLLAVKSQDTAAALSTLARCSPSSTPIVCLQNGVANERLALRFFERVYAVPVMCPASHLVPGVVQANSTPITGLFDIGRYPDGVDDLAVDLAAALAAATFDSVARPDIMRWKYAKLLLNLSNAVEAVCGPGALAGSLARIVVEEGRATLGAAGIDFATADEDAARRGDLLTLRRINGERRAGGSSWQSLQRGIGSIETDYLNGEIVLIGRRHGVATPANALLQQLAREAAVRGLVPGSTPESSVLEMLGSPRRA